MKLRSITLAALYVAVLVAGCGNSADDAASADDRPTAITPDKMPAPDPGAEAAGGESNVASSGACPPAVRYKGVLYTPPDEDTAVVDPRATPGGSLGTAEIVFCDDQLNDGQEPPADEKTEIRALEGIDPAEGLYVEAYGVLAANRP